MTRSATPSFAVTGRTPVIPVSAADQMRPAGRQQPAQVPSRALAHAQVAVTTAEETIIDGSRIPAGKEAEVAAHERVHQDQFALGRSRTQFADPMALEREAHEGSKVLLAGSHFVPTLAAGGDQVLTYPPGAATIPAPTHASAGDWLPDFSSFLADTTTYDVAGIDWNDVLPAMLSSNRIVYSDEQFTAIELSDRLRYQFVVELFSQDLAAQNAAPGGPPNPAVPGSGAIPGGLVTPSVAELEDALFEEYLPTLDAGLFAAADLAEEGSAFLEHWLGKLEGIRLVPDTFDIASFRPPDSGPDIDRERERLLEDFMAAEVPDLMFGYMLDEFARSVAGPDATVQGAPLITGGGEFRSITAEQWLAGLDLDTYKERLVAHLSATFDQKLLSDKEFQQLLLSSADQMSRFRSLLAIHLAIASQQDDLDFAVDDLYSVPMSDLDAFELDLFSDPALFQRRLSEASKATTRFYGKIQPGADNDAALVAAVDALIDALSAPGDHEIFAGLLRVTTLASAYKKLREDQAGAARTRLDELVKVSYDQIAKDIKEMASYAAWYLDKVWIPELHKVALRRITANSKAMQDLKDNWEIRTAETAGYLDGGATLFEDTADTLEDGTVDSVTLQEEVITAADAYRLRDAATIMRAEAAALRDPEKNSKRYSALCAALAGFDDVKGRIDRKEVDPNLYGPEVLAEAKDNLGLNTFSPYTTYADVLFGRAVASKNPFLARLVVVWKYAEIVDDAVQSVAIFAALGFLTIASLLIGGLGTVAFWVMFAIDATLSIGMGIHQVAAADALLELVRLDLDQSVTGLTVEQAESALKWAWIGLALTIVLTVGSLALGLALRYGTKAGESLAISLRYYRLAIDHPEVFASLRSIVRDPVRLSRMLDLAGDGLELQTLLFRMDSAMDLNRAERLLDLVGDAARVNRMLDTGHDAIALQNALEQFELLVPNGRVRLWLLDSALDDVVSLNGLVGHTGTDVGDLARLRTLLDKVPADRLLGLARARPLRNVEDLLGRGFRLVDLEAGFGLPGGGATPAVLDPRVPVPPAAQALLASHGLDTVPELLTATEHEAKRLIVVLGSNSFPKKAGPEISKVAAAWAAEGIDGPTAFVNRWEYARERFKVIRGGLDPALYPGKSLEKVAGDLLLVEIRGGTLTGQLVGDVASVRALVGQGWTKVPGATADEIVASVRRSSSEMTFGTDTTTAYHVRKHGKELAPSEAAPAADFERSLAAYSGSARRTIATGDATVNELGHGMLSISFTRTVRDTDGARQMTTQVFVRDGHALITTYGGARLP